MIDRDTFLIQLYVMIDDFCKVHLPPAPIRPGPKESLSVSEILTLAVFGQWYFFKSQRDAYRYLRKHLRSAFPNLPCREQLNRLMRAHHDQLVAFFLHLVEQMGAQNYIYEILDTSGVPVRSVKRRGLGWLGGEANIGMCTRMGWYFGFRLLISVNPEGAITGYGFAPGSTKEQPFSEAFLGLRAFPNPRLPSVGARAHGYYLTDQGFAGESNHQRWREAYGAQVIGEPQSHATPWPKAWRRWLHGLRQTVETSFDKLFNFFRLDKERPHDISGFQTNLAAKATLHNFCIWLNKQLGRAPLAFADLLDW